MLQSRLFTCAQKFCIIFIYIPVTILIIPVGNTANQLPFIFSFKGIDETKLLSIDIYRLVLSINGLVTDGNTKLCCRGFILALFQSTTGNKIDSEHTRDYKRLQPVCETELLRATVQPLSSGMPSQPMLQLLQVLRSSRQQLDNCSIPNPRQYTAYFNMILIVLDPPLFISFKYCLH